jgi:hypothetical protein
MFVRPLEWTVAASCASSTKAPEYVFLLPRCVCQSGKCFCSPATPQRLQGENEHGTPLPFCAVVVLRASAALRIGVALAFLRGTTQSEDR